MKKTGILGGTFNPIHNQHLYLAECAYEQLGLSRVLMIPSGISYLKEGTNVLPSDIRYEMCALAAKDIPYIELSDIEIRRKGKSYTADTLLELKQSYPDEEFHLLMGTDTFFMLDKWKDPEVIFSNCILTVAMRESDAGMPSLIKDTGYTLSQKKEEYSRLYGARTEELKLVVSGLSSSMIRMKAGRGEDILEYVPESVARYIRENGLYK